VYVHVSSRTEVYYASVTGQNTLQCVMIFYDCDRRRVYLRVISRHETRFNRLA